MRILAAALLAATAFAAHADETEHKKELMEQHKAIAAAHEQAAQCLASGKSEEACHQELTKVCKKLPTIGTLCGMRKHRH